MSDIENLTSLLNLAPADHPLYSSWRMFVFRLQGSELKIAAVLLRQLYMLPNRANLDGFTNFIIANGFRGEGLVTTPTQVGNNEEQVSQMVARGAVFSGIFGRNESKEEKKPDHLGKRSGKQSKKTGVPFRHIKTTLKLRKTNVSIKRRMVVSSSDTDDERCPKRPVNWVFNPHFVGFDRLMNTKTKETAKNVGQNLTGEESNTDSVDSSSEHEVIPTPRPRIADIPSSSETEIRSSANVEGSKKETTVNPFRKSNFVLKKVPNTLENELLNLSEASKRIIVKGTQHHQIIKIGPNVTDAHGEKLSNPIKNTAGKEKAQGTKTIKWRCSKCKKDDFGSKCARDRHLRICLTEPAFKYKCPENGCGAIFDRSRSLQNHRKEHSANPKMFSCPYCQQRFFSQNERIQHVRRCHPKSYLKYFGEAKSDSSSDD